MNDKLLEILAAEEGYEDVMEMLTEAASDSVVPAICTSCKAVGQMEPDQTAGHCSGCNGKTMVSCLILAGLI